MFKVIKKNNKFYVNNEFFGDMMIYNIKTKPYIKRLSEKFYLSDDLKTQLYAML